MSASTPVKSSTARPSTIIDLVDGTSTLLTKPGDAPQDLRAYLEAVGFAA